VAAYANAYMNIGLNSTYPTGTKETATLSSITSGVCVIRFYFRCTDTWETNVGAPGVNGGVLGNLKWLRFYGNSGSQADTDGCFVHVTRGHDTNAEGSSFRILDYSNDCTWHYYRTGVDIQDGNWHSCCTKITRLNTTNTNPNLNTKVWWDDWDMSGDPKCDRNVYHSTWGTNFSYLSMHQNWSGTVPQLAMGIDLDKVEVWDDAPEVGNPEVSALQCEGETTPGAVTDITPEFSAYVTKGANNVSKMEIQVSATDAFDGDLVYDSGSLNLDPVLTDSGRTDDKSYGD